MAQSRYLVIGAGHGGKAMAAHLALMGFKVNLYNRTLDNVLAIKQRKGIELESFEHGPRGFGRLELVTNSMAEALAEADIVMVVVPSTAHADIARACSGLLRDGQIVVLHPGRTGGTLEFTKILRDSGCKADIALAEAETLIYAARSDGPAQSRIFGIKETVPLAAMPSCRTQQVLDALAPAYPQFIDGGDVLHTGLNNMGAIFHPALTILNAGRIESTGGDFQFYLDGATPSIAKMLEELDRERVTVAAALGIRARTAQEWLKMAYNATGANLYEAIHNQPGYRGINAPATLNNRYIFEDVPMSLVPIASFGQRYGVAVSAIDAIIRLACIIHQTDYWRRGRTLAKLGIEQLAVNELRHYVETGETQQD
ncbi:MAG: NAD/NADP octopine/nopaline dehydrogenase family protein [Anaerolineae bacterium]